MLSIFLVLWLLSIFLQIILGLRCPQWTGWILPILFLGFAIYIWVYLVHSGYVNALSVSLVVLLPCIWLPVLFYTAFFYRRWKHKN